MGKLINNIGMYLYAEFDAFLMLKYLDIYEQLVKVDVLLLVSEISKCNWGCTSNSFSSIST